MWNTGGRQFPHKVLNRTYGGGGDHEQKEHVPEQSDVSGGDGEVEGDLEEAASTEPRRTGRVLCDRKRPK